MGISRSPCDNETDSKARTKTSFRVGRFGEHFQEHLAKFHLPFWRETSDQETQLSLARLDPRTSDLVRLNPAGCTRPEHHGTTRVDFPDFVKTVASKRPGSSIGLMPANIVDWDAPDCPTTPVVFCKMTVVMKPESSTPCGGTSRRLGRGSFSAVSKRNFARKYAFDSIF